MARNARTDKLTRRTWVLAGLGLPVLRARAIPVLSVRLDGEMLYVSAPEFHFIVGKPLERLKDGASVVFLSQLSLSLQNGGPVFRRAAERFVVSYDLWEEKFSVTRLGGKARTGSRLSASAAELWCLDSMSISTAGLAPDRPFWLRLEVRAAEPKDEPGVVGEPGINLTRLIEVFSRPTGSQQAASVLQHGPLWLNELRKAGVRGPRPE